MEAVSVEVADAGAAAQRPTAGDFSRFEWEKRNENGGCPEVPSREARDE